MKRKNSIEIFHFEQNTPDWYKARLGIPTASSFHRLITPTGKESSQIDAYAKELAAESLMTEDDIQVSTFATRRGHDLEEQARVAYQEETLSPVDIIGFVRNGLRGVSPDGWVDESGAIEIKCLMKKSHFDVLLKRDICMDYYPQIQGHLLVAEREWCDFISYHPLFEGPEKLFIKRVYRDESFISLLDVLLDRVVDIRDSYTYKINGIS